MNQHVNLRTTLFLLLSTGLLFSCEKVEQQTFQPERQFMPGLIRTSSGQTEATLQWSPSLFTEGKDVDYTVEVSKDSLFQNAAELTKVTDSTALVITDNEIAIKQKYFARIRTNEKAGVPASKWAYSAAFTITGEQIFLPVLDAEVRDKFATLRWRITPGITRLVLTPAGGAAQEFAVASGEASTGIKKITGLTPSTSYTAEIFAGTKSKGITSFTTKEPSVFTVVLDPSDDLLAAIASAANNDVIGLEPGTYDYSAANLVLTEKLVTIQSTSGSPLNTKVHFKEITLKGNGAGVKVSGIEWDGTTAGADYFVNLVGLNSDGEAATFASITIDNSIVHNTDNCLIRGNRAANNAHKIDFIRINNSIMYNNFGTGYNYLTLDKMEFRRLDLTNSTFYNIGRAFIGWATNITVTQAPTVLIDKITLNSFGSDARNNIIFDANANAVNFTLQNSIVANSPKPGGSVGSSPIRATSTSALVEFRNNNYFRLEGGTPLAPLVFPAYVIQASNRTIDLGWTGTTTSFTLPANSELRTAGTSGGPIGDPRWAL